MNEKDVTFFSTLLNEEAEAVKGYVEEGSLGDKIAALNLMGQDQVETLKSNLTKQVKESHVSELVEQAKKGDLNSDLYKVIKGATLEMTEKDLAKEFGVTEYTGINDLVSKAISKNKGQKDDTKIEELNQKVAELQGINTTLAQEKADAEKSIRSEYEGKILNRDLTDQISAIPFDLTDVEDADLEKVTTQRKTIVQTVFDSKYALKFDGDKAIVTDKDGNVVQNPVTLEPLPVSDVLKTIPAELGIKLKSPESGGRGGKSSGNGSAKFADINEFNKYCAEKGINPHGAEGIKIWSERRP